MSWSVLEKVLLAIFAAFLLAVPYLIPVIADAFWVSIITEILIWSLLAASVNFLFGYVGLLSFGQALYFGMGMYGVAIGVAKLGLSFWPAFGLGVLLSVAMAAITGVFAVRLTWHYFAIITVVFSLIFYFLAMTLKPLTGGDDGTVFSLPPTFTWGEEEYGLADPTFQYFFILVCVALCFYLKYRVLASPFGRGLMAIRENDTRAALIGLNVYRLRLLAFIVAGFFAGVAGALFALFGRYASASYMFYHVSGEAVVWAIVGGAGTLFGPIVGTSLLIIVREELSSIWEHYLLLVGAVAILVVIYAPKGVVGLWNGWVTGLASRGKTKVEEE
ncbi:branched-chain amino acid ABC transporter permease [Zeimonas arvi]|uniref:Branched-chain amino acid ABC transporter permease n=1 Tax=Zeimonas arvi TaxID=2498847 RepID=A0A5C8P5D4_9BURK|nr:branched-chain amino acid ABC transporter permease [Zeimonas arvi]TXL68619.1 branched-chain amino acid ABC transporter permease [Zeimonas arvi]